MPDESNYGCPECGAAMSECYNEVTETVTRNTSYSLVFDPRNPEHPDRGDGDCDEGSQSDDEDQGVRCASCGYQFGMGDFVRITGFVPRPYPERNRACDGVASQFSKHELNHFVRVFREEGFTEMDVSDRFYKNALRLFLQVPIPFAVPTEKVVAARKALRDHSQKGPTFRFGVWTDIGELFRRHYDATAYRDQQ